MIIMHICKMTCYKNIDKYMGSGTRTSSDSEIYFVRLNHMLHPFRVIQCNTNKIGGKNQEA